MADTAVLLAAKKIGVAAGKEALNLISSQLSKEVSLLTQLPGSMNRIRREFVVMQSMLSQIDTNKDNDQAFAAWIEEVRKLANGVEDIIDEYIHLGRPHGRGCYNYVKKMIKRLADILAWRRIASELKELETDLLHLSQIKDRWTTVPEGGASSSSSYAIETQLHLADHSHFIDEDEIVGIEENKNKLTEWLATDQEPARSIISVWGIGGLGKSTLVASVYKSENKNFGCHAWISVSQTYKIEDLLRKLVKELYGKEKEHNDKEMIPNDIATMDHRKLKETLRSFLERRRYLIILDDIWNPVAFREIDDAFVHNELGSRIVITTRSPDVASLAPDNHKLELEALKENDAWDLFCKKAFWKETDRKCPEQLRDLSNQILDVCQGLPLAIESIGGFLSLTEKTKSEWSRFYNQLTNWELDNNPNLNRMKEILNLSYHSLPRHLKNCFLYCTIFPEDYLLKRKKLIRLWISEGFVEERGTNTMEEVAEYYLKELVHSCMLQVEKRNQFGRIKYCRINNIVRGLAFSTSRKENFTMACDSSETVRIGGEVRRLAVHRCNNAILSSSYLPQLRSFVVFDTTISSSLIFSVSSCSRYLTVLDLEGIPIESLPDEVGDLFNLHYLGLRGTKVKKLPKSLRKLHELQTLDVMRTEIGKLPHGITKLKKLRHLFAEKILDSKNREFHNRSGVQAPKGLWNLRDLQTLLAVEASKDTVKGLGNLTQLRSLRIWKVRSNRSAQLWASIANMRFLSFLSVTAYNESEESKLVEPKEVGSLPRDLLKFYLKGRLEVGLLKSSMFKSLGCNLRTLTLACCGLKEDPLPFLSHMSNLVVLWLQRAFDGEKLCFQEGWFPNLKELYLIDMSKLNQVVAEERCMERLDFLYIRDLRALKDFPQGIKSLTSLRKIHLKNLNQEFRRKFQETDGRSEFQNNSDFAYFFRKEGEEFKGYAHFFNENLKKHIWKTLERAGSR